MLSLKAASVKFSLHSLGKYIKIPTMNSANPVVILSKRIVVSLLLGMVGLFLNLYNLSFYYIDLELHLNLGHILPLLVAFAWGPVFSFPGAIAASSYIFFVGNLGFEEMMYQFLFNTLWIPLIGWQMEKQRFSDGNPFFHYYLLLLYAFVNTIIYITFYNLLTGLELSRESLFIYSYVDNMSALSCLNMVHLIFLFSPARSFFGLPRLSIKKRKEGERFILIALVGVFLLWGFNVIIRAVITGNLGGEGSLDSREMGEILVNNLLYLNIVIILAIVMYRNWELESDTDRKVLNRGDILATILNNISEGVLVLDGNWKICFANPAAMEMGNYEKSDVGKTVNRVVFLHSSQTGLKYGHKEIIDILIKGKPIVCLLARRGGTFRRILITFSTLPQTKNAYKYLALIRDVTEEYDEEQRKIHTQKQEAVGRLVGGVAHDFNNRLAGIMGFAQLICSEKGLNDIYYYADQIIESAQSASELTSQLLTFSRKKPLQKNPLEINKLVKGILSVLKHTISKGIVIHFKTSDQELFIRGDRSFLENALLNLSINGAHAMKTSGTLSFCVEEKEINEVYCIQSQANLTPGKYGRIVVSDTGTGIEEKLLEKIFDPFFTTKKEGEGTGLGLSTVKEIVEKHGGEITVQSSLGKGTNFTLLLPLSQDREERA
jgi:signal transduction histidine kinase